MAEHYKLEIGRAIARRRKDLGLTQKELAERTHYKEATTISRWERGENLPNDLEVVTTALDWTLADLMEGITPPDRRTARKLGVPPPAEPVNPFRVIGGATEDDRLERLLAEVARLTEVVELLAAAVAPAQFEAWAKQWARTESPERGRSGKPSDSRDETGSGPSR